MQIKSKLVYQRSTGKLVGFMELGSLNDEFQQFQSSFDKGDDITRDFATHVLVYMVRGIFTSLIYPFGYFGTQGATGAQLYPCTMEAIRVLHSIDLEVRAVVSDGASPNRKLFKILTGQEEYWGINPHSLRKLYVIADGPHLIKTTRNCVENSKWNRNTRHLHVRKYLFYTFNHKKYVTHSVLEGLAPLRPRIPSSFIGFNKILIFNMSSSIQNLNLHPESRGHFGTPLCSLEQF